jgi:hypothetical protein
VTAKMMLGSARLLDHPLLMQSTVDWSKHTHLRTFAYPGS